MSFIGNCSICRENIQMAEFVILRNCRHGFHQQCIEHWLQENNSCPFCRTAAYVGDISKPIVDPPVADQQILKFDSNELKNNKMNLADCAPKLGFAENGLLVTSNENGYKSVRAILPVPKFDPNAKEKYIAFYFEGHIKKTLNRWWGGIGIGFCSSQFPLEGIHIGKRQNSIGISRKQGMDNCGKFSRFQQNNDPFEAGDKIGLGLIYEPKNASIKCFAICHRKLLGSVELPANFFDLPIFPVVGLSSLGNEIHLNFVQEDWDFDPRQVLELIQ